MALGQELALGLATVAVIGAAEVLDEFAPELRDDVVFHMTTLGKVSPPLIAEMEVALEATAQSEMVQDMSVMGVGITEWI